MSKQYETVLMDWKFCGTLRPRQKFSAPAPQRLEEHRIHTCPVCTGMPGSLPVLNKQVVEYAVAVGLATNCTITRYCKFDRKNYFYPDNPQNYQISQLYLPMRNGSVKGRDRRRKEKYRHP